MASPCGGNPPAPAPPLAPARPLGGWAGLSLDRWKLTLPIGSKNKPTEILQPALKTFRDPRYFYVNDDKDGVIFRAHCGGVTTKNSTHPRSELREMLAGGRDEAGWSTTRGTHALTIQQSINHLPVEKPHVVAGQVHDENDDVCVFRLEGNDLWATQGDDPHGTLIDGSYVLGTSFEAKFVAANGQIKMYYNGVLKQTLNVSRGGMYFKAGCYNQSSTSDGDAASAYGEVEISFLGLVHS